jgi:hypothetical protein
MGKGAGQLSSGKARLAHDQNLPEELASGAAFLFPSFGHTYPYTSLKINLWSRIKLFFFDQMENECHKAHASKDLDILYNLRRTTVTSTLR